MWRRVLHSMACMVVLGAIAGATAQDTEIGFYQASCPRAESIVRSTVEAYFNADPAVAPKLLRMHFHDCFVRGCDGSVLIDGPSAEKAAAANLGLRGFEVIDDAKAQLEQECPGTVSCADILTLAARDSVNLVGGPSWEVPMGRRDGFVSAASDVDNLPSFTDSIDVQKQKFAQFDLSTRDLVTLVGAHTIGSTQCRFFQYRLYNFTSDKGPDPTIDPDFLERLRSQCPPDGDPAARVVLDEGSELTFDANFYANIRNGVGVLESDQKLWTDDSTRRYAGGYVGLLGSLLGTFEYEFSRSMVRMSNIGVLTGIDGEVRRVCSAFNG